MEILTNGGTRLLINVGKVLPPISTNQDNLFN